MLFTLAIMACLSGHCRWIHMDLPDAETCHAMRSLVAEVYRAEGLSVFGQCVRLTQEVRR